MRLLERQPRFTFTSLEQIALEYVRIYQLPHDVLYDFKILAQWDKEDELVWSVHDVVDVKAKRQNPFSRSIRWRTEIDFEWGVINETKIEIPTLALLNEFGEVVGFKDLFVTMFPGDTLKIANYSLSCDYDSELQRQYS